MDPIHLRFIYTVEEYARAAGVYQVKHVGIIRTYALYFVLIVACLLAFGAYQGYANDLLVIGLPVLVTAAGFASLFFTIPRGWKKAFLADPLNRQPFTWEIDEQGVSMARDITQVHFDWPYFRELLETEEFFFFIGTQSKTQFYFVPKRAFESDEQMQLRELARKFIQVKRVG